MSARHEQKALCVHHAYHTEFFILHEEIDLVHSAAEADVLASTIEDEFAVEQAAQRAIDAWWGFLDGVERVRNAGK